MNFTHVHIMYWILHMYTYTHVRVIHTSYIYIHVTVQFVGSAYVSPHVPCLLVLFQELLHISIDVTATEHHLAFRFWQNDRYVNARRDVQSSGSMVYKHKCVYECMSYMCVCMYGGFLNWGYEYPKMDGL